MKHTMAFLFALLISSASFGQNITDFLVNHGGMQDAGYCAHLTNTFDFGYYDLQQDRVTLEIHYKDVNLDNNFVVTKITLHLGNGILPFDGIAAESDNDYVNPFAALEWSCWLVQQTIQRSDSGDYEKIRNAMITLLGTDPDYWNGADWALFVMNLDYISYAQ